MKIRLLHFTLAAIAISAAFHVSARAATNTWTDGFGTVLGGGPYWVNVPGFGGNWSRGTVPVASDDVIFPSPVVPPNATFKTGVPPFGPLADGRTIVLFPGSSFPPPLVANSLTFLDNYNLVTAAATFNAFGFGPFAVEPLTLTSGNITVGNGFTATIIVPLIPGNGTVTKWGPGTVLIGDVPTTVSSLNGEIVPGQAAVLGNLLVQEGTLGTSSPAPVHIVGNYIQAKTGALSIQIASPTAFSQLIVGRSAQLSGMLDVSLLNGFLPSRGEKFTIVAAASGLTGDFDNVNAPVFDFLTLRQFYTSDTLFLEAVVASFDALPGLTPNQHAVARNLDAVIDDPREANLLNYLYSRDLNKLPGDFDKIAPEELTSIFTIGVALAQVQSLNVQRRTDDIRSGSSGFSAAGLAINGSGPSYSGPVAFRTGMAGPSGNDGKESKEMKAVTPEEKRWGVFLSGTGEWVSVGDDNNARGYDLSSGGFTLGIDYKVTPNFAIGLAAGYTGTTADLVDRGRVWVNGGKLGLYATVFQNEQEAAPTMSKDSSKEAPAPAPSIAKGFYADIAVFGGYNSYDTRRSALQGEARGSTDGGELNVLFGAGYDFKRGALTFGPTATFNYTYIGTNEFTEHGSLAPLDIHGGKGESLRTAFGLKASYDWKVGGILIKPELRAAWQHEYGDSVYDISSNFANGGGGTFLVSGPKVGRDSALLGAGFAIQCSERCSTYFYYDGELGRQNYHSAAVTGGVRFAF